MADEEAGTEGPPMAPKPKELEGWPPTVPGEAEEALLSHLLSTDATNKYFCNHFEFLPDDFKVHTFT